MRLFQDGFDHYGDVLTTARLRMLDGVYAQVDTFCGPEYPSFGARTGVGALKVSNVTTVRRVLPANKTTLYQGFGLYVSQLPSSTNGIGVMQYRSDTNTVLYTLYLQPNGSLELVTVVDGVSIAATPALTIAPSAWNYIETKLIMGSGTGQFEIKVDGVQKLNGTNLTLTGTVGMLAFAHRSTGTPNEFYIDDWVVNDASGSYNTGFPGQARVAAIYARSDTAVAGWTPRPRYKFGNGILDVPGANDAITCSDAAPLEIGSAEFVVEGFFRWRSLPGATQRHTLFAKWRESTNARSYRLYLGGASVNGGKLAWDISTDGTAGTVATIMQANFTPVTGRWYHIAVVRDNNTTVIFVDGKPLGAPAADANAYANTDALFCIGGQQDGTTSILDDTSLDGWVEEFRFTNGVPRYNLTGFTPPSAAFGRNVGADSDFASVVLLLGFDTALTDESSYGRAVTARGDAARLAPDDDATNDYKTINQSVPRDDTYMEAPYVAASGVLTFTGQPANGETVSLDGVTYTFNTVLGGAGSILIGASVTASIDNLVAAINGDAGEGTLYGTGTSPSNNTSAVNRGNNQMEVTANTPGTAGNSIATTETVANATWTSTTLTGGLNIPGESEFLFERLPAGTTAVQALTIVRRTRKTDGGAGSVQSAFVTADGSSANGSDDPVTLAFIYYEDIIEQDPSTSAALTPASFVGAKFRIDRTA